MFVVDALCQICILVSMFLIDRGCLCESSCALPRPCSSPNLLAYLPHASQSSSSQHRHPKTRHHSKTMPAMEDSWIEYWTTHGSNVLETWAGTEWPLRTMTFAASRHGAMLQSPGTERGAFTPIWLRSQDRLLHSDRSVYAGSYDHRRCRGSSGISRRPIAAHVHYPSMLNWFADPLTLVST